MADAAEDEALRLLFQEGGIEVVSEAKESFASLTEGLQETAKAADAVSESTKTVDTTTQQAIQSLIDTSDVVEKLREAIISLKREREALTEKFLAGIISEEKYNDASKELEKTLGTKEATLKRVTSSVQYQIIEQQRLAEEMNKDAEKAKAVADSYLDVAMASESAGNALATAGTKAEEAAGTGEGESGKGGFAGLASGVLKTERAITSLATGHGVARAGVMLEPLVALLGGPAGLGIAIGGIAFAIESALPKLVTWIEKIDGAAEAAKRAAEALKKYHDEIKKEEEQPSEAEAQQADMVKLMFKGKGRQQTRQGIEQSLREQGFGLTEEDKEQLKKPWLMGSVRQDIENSQSKAIQDKTLELMKGLERGAAFATSEVSGMAGRRPDQFPVEFAEALETAKETPEQTKAANEEIEEEDLTRQGRKVARFAAAKEYNAKHRREVARQKKEDAEIIQEANQTEAYMRAKNARVVAAQKKEDAAIIQEANQDEALAKHEESLANAKARQSTFEAQNRRAAAAQQNEAIGEAQKQNQLRGQFGGAEHPAFEPSDLQQVVAQVGRNRLMNSSLGYTLAQQVDYYMGQLEAKMVDDYIRGMQQQFRSYQQGGSPY